MKSFLSLIKFRMWKFEEDCLKTVGNRFFMKLSFFTVLFWSFYKEQLIKLSDSDPKSLLKALN